MTCNYRLTISYDGTGFRGWQKQGNTENTIQGKLEAIAAGLVPENMRESFGGVDVNGAGRTDAGVHALCQCASMKLPVHIPCDEIKTNFNRYLPETIRITDVSEADDRFHARLCATEKTYIYNVWAGDLGATSHPEQNIFIRKYSYLFDRQISVDLLKAAADKLCGTHDFAGFCTKVQKNKSSVRTVTHVELCLGDKNSAFGDMSGLLQLKFKGNGFLYNQIRIMVGTLLEIAAGERDVSSIDAIFDSKDRSKAGFTAPAHGLFLHSVDY